MAINRLEEVYQLGQSIWYDNIRRGLITSGDLQRLIDNDAVVGVTSNPTIFEKAIDDSDDYDEAIRELIGQGVTSAPQVVEALMIRDIQMAADTFRPVFERTNHADGYVSIEVAPALAHDTKQTIAEARRLFQLVERPNVMVKIPATEEGLPAIEQMIYEGVNINVTLIFALDRYEAVTEAYIRGLEHRRREGQDVSGIASVASFFVSRVDTLVDKLLDERIGASDDTQKEALRALQGQAAIANARLAYEKYRGIFHGKRFEALESEHAQRQRCLWASTSTKNPAYPDTYYIDTLIGPETVDTIPPQTIVAFQDHGTAKATLAEDLAGMHAIMGRLADVGINMDDVTHQLEVEGVKAFAESYQKLLAATEEKIARLHLTPRSPLTRGEGESQGAEAEVGTSSAPTLAGRVTTTLGSYQQAMEATLERADAEHFARRVWEKDPTLWKPAGQDQREIVDRLGWLTVTEQMYESLARLNDLRDDVRRAGFTHAVLLGMGGSSLAPEVLRETFGVTPGQPDLIVLDSTDPATILDDQQAIDLRHTLFIVASKSGGTLETLSQYRYFYAKIHELAGDQAGSQFIAITDPGTKLEQLAKDHKFRAIFRNPPDIGGRYAALSFFGLVPAAIIGVDVEKLLGRAQTMQQACPGSGEARQNPGLYLGAVMGTLANAGRDKVTLVMSPPISTFGYWIEQLIAESTGKEGKGVLPVEGEALGSPAVYGDDRLFVYLRTDQGYDDVTDTKVRALEEAGQPVVRIALEDAYDLGMEFFRWEFATAVAGALLGINAFNQPNVQEAKDNTDRILAEYAVTKTLLQPPPILRTDHVAIVASEREARKLVDAVSLQAALETYFRQVRPGDYVALLAYVQKTGMTEDSLEAIRARLRDLTKAATTLGYGPRFQHSTGQLHKGGPNTGVFVQFVAEDEVDASIPDEPYTFGILKQAQALGDLRSLEAHGRRVIRLALGADVPAGLAEVQRALDAARMP